MCLPSQIWEVRSCSLMNNKCTYSEAQQPPLFKPRWPAMVGLVADFTCNSEKCVVAAGQALQQRFMPRLSSLRYLGWQLAGKGSGFIPDLAAG